MTGMKLRMPKGLLAIVSLILVFASSEAFASIDYTVKNGDTLYRIAKKYDVSVSALQAENGVSARKLRPGMILTIPSSAKAAPEAEAIEHSVEQEPAHAALPPEADVNLIPAKEPSESKYHSVKRGETLSSIARIFSVKVADLKELNNLKSSKVKAGQKLLVKAAGPRTYTVKRGDTVSKIAFKFGMDSADLMALNGMESASIRPGQRLYLEEKEKAAPVVAAAHPKIEAAKFEEEIRQVSQSEEFKAEPPQNRLITIAKKLLDTPYKFGGNTTLGIDCSAYVRKAYSLLEVKLPRTAREQFKTGQPVEKDELSAGDLVFFRTYASFPSHVGIYIGNNLFIHASSMAKKVTIDSLDTPYYLKRFIGAKRLLRDAGNDLAQN